MSKPLDTEYFQLLDLECEFIEAGCDVIAARENARLELQRRRNADEQFDVRIDDWANK